MSILSCEQLEGINKTITISIVYLEPAVHLELHI